MLSRREVLHRTSLAIGFAISGSAASAILSGCRSNPAPDWTPVFLNTGQVTTLAAMLDHLLPTTATPGATDLMVDRFLDAYLKDYASSAEQQAFTEGLAGFDRTSQTLLGKSFVSAAAAEKDRVFQKYEEESPGLAPTIWGGQLSDKVAPPTFYRRFKQLALMGYYTSTEVGETLLAYDPIPGRYDGCVPLSDVGKAWSL